jgi:hypothetical protein
MDGFPSLVPSRRRSSCRTAMVLGTALSILCVGTGCGDFTLFGEDEEGVCNPDPCASKANAIAGTCTDLGDDDYNCGCQSGYFWDEDGNTCEDPCASDPCDSIENAVNGSCGGTSLTDYDCDCDPGYVWDRTSDSCEDDPCDPDPCASIENATPDTCTAAGGDDYSCGCRSGFTWIAQINQCEPSAVGTCDDLEACLLTCNGFEDSSCQSSCYAAWTGCECDLDFNDLLASCALTCFRDCPLTNPFTKSCWDCVIPCGFDSQCP